LPYLGSILPGVAVWSLDSPIGLSLLEDFDVGFDEIFYNAMRYGVVQNLPLHITCRFTISESNFVRMTISNKVLISQLKRDLKEKSIDHPTESGVLGIRAFWERMGFSVKDTYEELVRSWEMGEEQFEYYVCLEGNGLLTN